MSHSVSAQMTPPSNMDDANRLIAELQSKLCELEDRADSHRKSLLQEFEKHLDALLEGVSEEVKTIVSRTIADSSSRYPSLFATGLPPSQSSPPSPSTQVEQVGSTTAQQSPSQPPSFKTPRDREADLRGLFTPNYLPLLDGSDQPLASPPPSPAPAITSPTPSPSVESRITEGTQTTETSADPWRPSAPQRRNTDTSSVDSSISETTVRRSALRRSSTSSNKASPRRVRFMVEEGEVLPSSSPLMVQSAGAALHHATDLSRDNGSLAGDSDQLVAFLSPGEEAKLAPARKVSSSEKLRALSKVPFDDPSVWTVVDPQANTKSHPEPLSTPQKALEDVTATRQSLRWSNAGSSSPPRPFHPDSRVEPRLDRSRHHNEDASSDEDFMEMKPKARGKGPAAAAAATSGSSHRRSHSITLHTVPEDIAAPEGQSEDESAPLREPLVRAEQTNLQSRGTTQNDNHRMGRMQDTASSVDEVEEDDQLFNFDDDKVGHPLTRMKPVPKPYLPEEDANDQAANAAIELSYDELEPVSRNSRVPIVKSPDEESPIAASMGSYRNRPITTFDVVKDRSVSDRAAQMGGLRSFVGSVDGRSGVDGGDFQSFRASLSNSQHPGTPRSMTERLIMEEFAEGRRSQAGSDI